MVLNYQAGDNKALDMLVKRWHPKLLRQAYWHTRDSEAAKDIAQDCCTDIIKAIHQLQYPARFNVWLYKIAYRKSVDWIRRQQRERDRNAKDVEESLYFQSENKEQDVVNMLGKYMQQLPGDSRMILKLFYLDNFNIREIANILSIPVGTVKSRLFHAREKLKKTFKSIEL